MKSKLIARRQQPQAKVSTVLVSKETIEDAIRFANQIAEGLMESNPNDPKLDQIEEAASFLSSILTKSPAQMQQEGAASTDDYTDDAVNPESAQKAKQYVELIRQMRNEAPTPAPDAMAPAAPAPADAPVMASGSDNFVMNDEVEKGGEKAEVPRLAAKKKVDAAAPVAPAAPAAPVAPAAAAPAPAAPPEPAGEMTAEGVLDIIPTEMILKIVEDLPKRDDFHANQNLQNALIYLTELLKTRPVEAPEPEAAAAPKAASAIFGGLKLAAADPGGNWTSGGGRGSILEDGGRTPEISQAHKAEDDNTGISRPATEDIRKFAADMTSSKALKLAEKCSNDLKGMYLEAKPLVEFDSSRPVREAVESIYRSYDLMGEATKALNKTVMAEKAEEEAVQAKEKKSSLLGGLKLAAAEDEDKKCKCGKPVYGKYGEYSRCKDCYESQGAEAERATGVQ